MTKHIVKFIEENYRLLFYNHPIPMWVYDLDTLGFIEVNNAAITTYGYSREEFLTMTLKDIRPPDDIPLLLNHISGRRPTLQNSGIWKHRFKNGTLIDVDIRSHTIEFDGKPYVLVVATDVTEQIRAEKTLRESEHRYRTIVETSHDLIWSVDAEGRYTYVNDASKELFGYEPQELIGKPFFIVIDPDYPGPTNVEQFHDMMKDATQFRDVETHIRHRNGTKRILLANSVIQRDAKGNLIGVSGASYDITSRKTIERALIESEERFRQLTENIHEVFWLSDTTKQTILYISPAYETIWGKSRESLYASGITWVESIHPEDRERIMYASRTKQTAGTYNEEYRIIGSNGEIRWIRDRAFPVKDASGKVYRIAGVAEDITKAKLTETALKEKTELLESYFTNALDLFCIANLDGIFLHLNKEWENTLGYTLQELEGRPLFDFIHPNDLATTKERIRLLFNNVETRNFVNRYRHKNGTYRWIEWRSLPHDNLIYAAARDITERVLLEEERNILEAQLHQAQKLESLGTLASGIAHDFNNILTIIIGHASLLTKANLDSDSVARNSEAIITAGTRGANLIQQMLTFARKSEIRIESIRMNDVVSEAVRFLEQTFPKTIAIVTKLSDNNSLIKGDSTQLYQVILNLCVNAKDAMANSGTLIITTCEVSALSLRQKYPDATALSYVGVQVTDTGTGMNETTLERIFEPFFTTKEQGKGTGLGLSMVYGIVKRHQGMIDVQSALGKGTTFSVYFPSSEVFVTADENFNSTTKQTAGGKETILVVDDEEMVREMVSIALESLGYKVIKAIDGAGAIKVFQQEMSEINVVLSDFGLPSMNGFESYKQMKKLQPNVKFILASGFIDPAEQTVMLTAGIKEIIQKPYTFEQLNTILRRVINQP